MDTHETASNSAALQSESVSKSIQIKSNQTNQSCHELDERTSLTPFPYSEISTLIEPGSVSSNIAQAFLKISELEKKKEELEKIITEMKTYMSDRDQTILQQETTIELLEASNDVNSLKTIAEKQICLSKKVGSPLIEKPTIQQTANDGSNEKRKRGRPKANGVIKPVRSKNTKKTVSSIN